MSDDNESVRRSPFRTRLRRRAKLEPRHILEARMRHRLTDGNTSEYIAEMAQMKALVVRLPLELRQALEKAATKERRSVSDYVRILLEDALKVKKK